MDIADETIRLEVNNLRKLYQIMRSVLLLMKAIVFI